MQCLECIYTKPFFVVHLKFKFDWAFAKFGHAMAWALDLAGAPGVRLGAPGGVLRELHWGLKTQKLVFAIHGINRVKTRIPLLMSVCFSYDYGDSRHSVKNNKQRNKALSLMKRASLLKQSYNKTTSNKLSNKLPVLDYSFLKKWKEKVRKRLG